MAKTGSKQVRNETSVYEYERYRHYLPLLEKCVRWVGELVMGFVGQVMDTGQILGHEESTIDEFARERVQSAIDRWLPELQGTLRFELRPMARHFLEMPEGERLAMIIDEVEGTTNTKRALASPFDYRPRSGISIALTSESGLLRDVLIGVFYDLSSQVVFSAIRIREGCFQSFWNAKRIDPEDVMSTLGDSKTRLIVPGYSNTHRIEKGELEQLLVNQGFKVYGGCRSSGVDAVDIVRNQFDASVDCRALWSTKDGDGNELEAMVQVYDIAGILPFVLGCGMKVSALSSKKKWTEYGLMDSIPLLISRPEIHDQLMELVLPMAEKWVGEEDKRSVEE